MLGICSAFPMPQQHCILSGTEASPDRHRAYPGYTATVLRHIDSHSHVQSHACGKFYQEKVDLLVEYLIANPLEQYVQPILQKYKVGDHRRMHHPCG